MKKLRVEKITASLLKEHRGVWLHLGELCEEGRPFAQYHEKSGRGTLSMMITMSILQSGKLLLVLKKDTGRPRGSTHESIYANKTDALWLMTLGWFWVRNVKRDAR